MADCRVGSPGPGKEAGKRNRQRRRALTQPGERAFFVEPAPRRSLLRSECGRPPRCASHARPVVLAGAAGFSVCPLSDLGQGGPLRYVEALLADQLRRAQLRDRDRRRRGSQWHVVTGDGIIAVVGDATCLGEPKRCPGVPVGSPVVHGRSLRVITRDHARRALIDPLQIGGQRLARPPDVRSGCARSRRPRKRLGVAHDCSASFSPIFG